LVIFRAFIHSRSNFILKVLGIDLHYEAMSQDPLARLEVVRTPDLQTLVHMLRHALLPVIQMLLDLIHLVLAIFQTILFEA
jgi:hypothetical protein